jgi:hypothetical protein
MELQECGIGKSMGYKLKIDIPATVTRFDPRFQRAQKWLDNEVLKDSAPYTPFRTGNLMMSGTRGTVLGSGEVVYNAPYARACYYAQGRSFNPSFHPLATAQWFEKAKAVKLEKWIDGVGKVIKGSEL